MCFRGAVKWLSRTECAQAAAKTNDTAGDGTTTATILSAAISAEGRKIGAAGTNPGALARGIEKTVAALGKELQALSVEVTDDDLANVATVSAGNNEVVRTQSWRSMRASLRQSHLSMSAYDLCSCCYSGRQRGPNDSAAGLSMHDLIG